ncbi:MAG: hypothetical protein LRZ85_03430 [Alphaproteobacteria bacterium]|nr:hypothetical protein [Alphaproteobacteria bacterium]
MEGAVDNDQVAVSIRLTNGKTLNAKIVGRDAVADIAVLKVDAPYRLPEIRWVTAINCVWVTGSWQSATRSA